jgi:eukaryotic-like serine/threonine-protein kinase
MAEVAELEHALERIQVGRHTAEDVHVLRGALGAGQIRIARASGQDSVAIGGNVHASIIVTGDGNYVVIQDMSVEELRKLLSSQVRLDPRMRKQRSDLLTKTRRQFVRGDPDQPQPGLLEQMLRNIPRLTLEMAYEADVLLQPPGSRQPAGRLAGHARSSAYAASANVLPPGSTIVDVFDNHDGQVLLLGAPGSGKTTLLLVLLEALLELAVADDALPMPLVFSLASWGTRRACLEEWLFDELTTRPGQYEVPQATARTWIVDERILPLLDGLDEVAGEHRAACVEKINAFQRRRRKDRPALVVTSRADQYAALRPTQLHLRGAVRLQPLSEQQVQTYLAKSGQAVVGLHEALQTDAELRKLAERPLLLGVMVEAYRGLPAATLSTRRSEDDPYVRLFATYVDRMFEHHGEDPRYPRPQTEHWLGWLARALTQRDQPVFYLERVQPDWLTTRALRRWYAAADRLGSGLLVALLSGLFIGLSAVLLDGLLVGLSAGLLVGLAAGLLAGLLGGRPDVDDRQQCLRRTIRRAIVGWLVMAVVIALVTGLCISLLVASGLAAPILGAGSLTPVRIIGVLVVGLLVGVLPGLAGAFASGVAGGPGLGPRSVVVVEAVQWEFSRALRSGSIGGILGLLAGLGLGLLFWFVNTLVTTLNGSPLTELPYELSELGAALFAGFEAGLFIAFGVGALHALIGGFDAREIPPRARPNEAIWRSAGRASLIGLAAGSIIALDLGVFFALRGDLWDGLSGALGFGVVFGLAGGLAYGGYACLSHLALRLVLWRADMLPLDTIRFLDYATERMFLRWVGGGYIFVHRLLQEYLAGLENDTGGQTPTDSTSAV